MLPINAVILAWKRPLALKRLLQSWMQSDVCGLIHLHVSIDGHGDSELEKILIDFSTQIPGLSFQVQETHLGLKAHVLRCMDSFRHEPLWLLEEDLWLHPQSLKFVEKALSLMNQSPETAGVSTYAQPFVPGPGWPFVPLPSPSFFFNLQYPSSSGAIWSSDALLNFKVWMESDPHFPEEWVLPSISKWPESSWKKWMAAWLATNHAYMAYPYEGITTNMGDKGTHHHRHSNQFQGKLLSVYPENSYMDRLPVVKYDAFFEWEGFQWEGQSVSMNIYGWKKKEKLKQPFSIIPGASNQAIRQFGLQLKPLEHNFTFFTEGTDFSLVTKENVTPFTPLSSINWWSYHGFFPDGTDAVRMGFDRFIQNRL